MKIDESVDAKAAKVNLVAQEIKFAKLLAGNDPNQSVKEKQLRKLKTWLKTRANCSFSFTNNDCLRIWKGLFYSMWMSDKPLPQENLATQIASLIHCFENPKVSIQFFAMFLKTMSTEWNSIDQWRIDKFMMLVRRVTREMFIELKDNEWNADLLTDFAEKLKDTVLDSSTSRGLFMHFAEIYLEEVAKVTSGKIETTALTQLVQPFIYFIATQPDYKLVRHVLRNIFNHLLFQSDMGRDYKEKYDAWKAMGFPGNSIDDIAMEEVDDEEDDEEEDEDMDDGEEESEQDDAGEDDTEAAGENGNESQNEPLDPRAGRVDVVMHTLVFDAKEIADALENIKYKKFTRPKNRKSIDRIVNTFTTFASGNFPIGIKKIKINRDELELPSVEEKAEEFLEFENDLYGAQRDLKKMSKRKRKRVVADSTALEDLHGKVRKIAKSQRESNNWIEEEMPENMSLYSDTEEDNQLTNGKLNDVVDTPTNNTEISVQKLKKKKVKNSVDNKLNGTIENNNKSIVTATSNNVNESVTEDQNKSKSPKTVKSPKALKKSPKSPKTPTEAIDKWEEPLEEGEVEYLIPAKKFKGNVSITRIEGKAVNGDLTPVSHKKLTKTPMSTPLTSTPIAMPGLSSSLTASGKKNVKIMLKMNQSQEAVDYIRQLKQSPNLPFDSNQKPLKGVLKPNLMPSPINPFYKKMLGLK